MHHMIEAIATPNTGQENKCSSPENHCESSGTSLRIMGERILALSMPLIHPVIWMYRVSVAAMILLARWEMPEETSLVNERYRCRAMSELAVVAAIRQGSAARRAQTKSSDFTELSKSRL